MHATATTATPADSNAAARARQLGKSCERHFVWVILAFVAAAACVRIAILAEFLRDNPFAEFPTLDGELYWNRAGEMAAGRWFGDAPFHIAPLYSYLLGALRWAGGGLAVLYSIQMAVHLGTAALVGFATRHRFGSVAGCAAAAIFLALAEPALYATRVLGTTLQLLIATLLWYDWSRLTDATDPKPGHVARVGALLGLLALSFPAAMLLVPVYTVWLALRNGRGGGSLFRAAVGSVAALGVIGVATLHNVVVSGEFIPITSHAGITLAAGNGPGSIGIFTPLVDTHDNVKDQARESALAYELATGKPGSWQEIDRFYRDRVIEWWIANPGEAITLFARKAWWFATSLHYDNVTAFQLEREHGLLRRSAWVPLATPWILGLAVLGAAIAPARIRRYIPELSLVALPLFVCLAFMYSARYRAIALPVLCGLAGFAVAHWRSAPHPRAALAAAIAVPALLLAANAATGFGSLDFMRAEFSDLLTDSHLEAARARKNAGRTAAAEAQFRRAADAGPKRSGALRELAALQLAEGRPTEARASALAALRRNRDDEVGHRLLYDAQISSDDFRNAEVTLNLIEALAPSDGGIQIAMAWFYAACPTAAQRNGPRSLHHATAAGRILGDDDPNAVMALALAEAANDRFEAAIATTERGLALAAVNRDPELREDFETLQRHLRNRRVVASRPRLLAPAR